MEQAERHSRDVITLVRLSMVDFPDVVTLVLALLVTSLAQGKIIYFKIRIIIKAQLLGFLILANDRFIHRMIMYLVGTKAVKSF